MPAKKKADDILGGIQTPEDRRAAAQERAEKIRAERDKEIAAAEKKRVAEEKKTAKESKELTDGFPPEVDDAVRLQTLAHAQKGTE